MARMNIERENRVEIKIHISKENYERLYNKCLELQLVDGYPWDVPELIECYLIDKCKNGGN